MGDAENQEVTPGHVAVEVCTYSTSKYRWPTGKEYLNWVHRHKVVSKRETFRVREVNAEQCGEVELHRFVGIKFFDNPITHVII